MSSAALNLWFFGLINNVSGPQIGQSCLLPNQLEGICTPLYECRSALRDITQLRVPVYCQRNAAIPQVCCPTRPPQKYPPFEPEYPPTEPLPDFPEPPATIAPRPPNIGPSYPDPPPTEKGDTKERNRDRIVFDRLADRKCQEYSEFVYENFTYTHPDSSVTVERVNSCHRRIGPAVVGGVKAGARKYPHMALLGYGADENNVQWLCGGSIISLSHILTAAHCIDTPKGSPTFVRVGDLNHKATDDDAAPQTIPVTTAIRHEKYRPPYVYNDIGLLELERNIEVTQHVRPACLDTEGSILPTIPLVATGWGRTDFYGDSSPDLLEVDLEQFSTGECGKAHKPSQQLPMGIDGDSQLCAGSRHERKDTCRGDSGGPLQVQLPECMHKISGITSFGKGCGNIGVPGVYTRVSHFVDWIEERAFSRG